MSKISYLERAEKISKKGKDLPEVIFMIKDYLGEHFSSTEVSYKPHSIIESRFIPGSVAFRVGMKSCGSLTNIGAEMLRHVGYEIRKVHGSLPKSPDHAWLKVMNPKSKDWEDYDLTTRDCGITEGHTELAVCDEWLDIAEEIIKAHVSFSRQV